VATADSDLADRARALAAEVHAADKRKCSGLPYFEAHLEPVAVLVRQSEGSEIQVAAAYLHDAAEDHGGQAMLDRIRAEFGDDVADIVGDLSDSLTDTTDGAAKEAWSIRKQRYLAELVEKDQRSLEVSVADKLQNAQTTLADLKRMGVTLWLDFDEKRPEAQLWYYTTLVKVFEDRIPDHPLTSRMSAVVEAMERQVLQEVPHLVDRRPWSAPVDVP
jgi:(p)ppGpp synthase/HD superfamily hydrolase